MRYPSYCNALLVCYMVKYINTIYNCTHYLTIDQRQVNLDYFYRLISRLKCTCAIKLAAEP